MVRHAGLPATLLTISGLIPFVFFAWVAVAPYQLASLIAGSDVIALWQLGLLGELAYGAVILSFMAGARWGTSFGKTEEQPDTGDLVLAVLPALWAACAAVTGAFGILGDGLLNGGVSIYLSVGYYMLAGGLLVLLIFDLRAGYPSDYVRLRIIASVIAALCLAVCGWYVGPR